MERAPAFRRFKVAFARASVIGALVGVCALVLAAVAAAGQPTKTPVNDSVSVDFPAGTVCDFHYSLSGTFDRNPDGLQRPDRVSLGSARHPRERGHGVHADREGPVRLHGVPRRDV